MAAWSLRDKVILITGGARGIGAAAAAELARRGARPVLADLDTDGLTRTAAAITPAPMTVELDVTDGVACQDAVQSVTERFGRLDAVWANAGIASIGPVELTDPAAWTRTIEVNLLGAYYTIRAALPPVIAARGYVAATASLATFAHAPHLSAYCATKAGIEALCNSLRIELDQYGVGVATIHPSWIDTDMVREGDDGLGSFKVLRESMRAPFNRTYPVEKAARDIADGFERRRGRICTPWFVYLAQALRPALNTRAFVRDQYKAAPEMDRAFREQLAQEGVQSASVSGRTAGQLPVH